ncbi:MAG: hypothetical protein WCL04_00820 [Verrucomicrobiota bacterium]
MPARRDYILSIIEQVGRMLAQVIFQRKAGQHQQALQAIVQGCERLFGMEADQLFQFTPEQHFAMLADGEQPEVARDKVLLYATLCAEAGQIYAAQGNPTLARGSFVNALRLTLRARSEFSSDGLPVYAPDVAGLLEALKDAPLDADTAELMQAAARTSFR